MGEATTFVSDGAKLNTRHERASTWVGHLGWLHASFPWTTQTALASLFAAEHRGVSFLVLALAQSLLKQQSERLPTPLMVLASPWLLLCVLRVGWLLLRLYCLVCRMAALYHWWPTERDESMVQDCIADLAANGQSVPVCCAAECGECV